MNSLPIEFLRYIGALSAFNLTELNLLLTIEHKIVDGLLFEIERIDDATEVLHVDRLDILDPLPNLKYLNVNIHVRRGEIDLLCEFLLTHPFLSNVITCFINYEYFTDIVKINSIYKYDWQIYQMTVVWVGDESQKQSVAKFEGDVATYYDDCLISLQLRDTRKIILDNSYIDDVIELFNRSVFPDFERLQVVEYQEETPRLLPTAVQNFTYPIGDVIYTPQWRETYWESDTPMYHIFSTLNLVGRNYIVPFALSDVIVILKNGREFDSIGIFVDTRTDFNMIDKLEIPTKIIFYENEGNHWLVKYDLTHGDIDILKELVKY